MEFVTQLSPNRFRLSDGSSGTEYQALSEMLRTQQAKRLQVDERIEVLQIKLRTADGRPETP